MVEVATFVIASITLFAFILDRWVTKKMKSETQEAWESASFHFKESIASEWELRRTEVIDEIANHVFKRAQISGKLVHLPSSGHDMVPPGCIPGKNIIRYVDNSVLSDEEIEGVLAHEAAHLASPLKYVSDAANFLGTWLFLFSGAGGGIFLLYVLSLYVNSGVTSFYASVLGFISLFMFTAWTYLGIQITCITNAAISRRIEYAADKGALKISRYPNDFIHFMEKLDTMEGWRDRQSFYEKLFNTHPSPRNRVKNLYKHLHKIRSSPQ